MSRINTQFLPNTGIESITRQESETFSRLPDSLHVVPSGDEAAGGSLEKLFAPKLGASMQNFLTPDIASRELFLPSVFNRKLRQAADDLRKAARNNNSRTLRHAADVLDEDADLKNLLSTYRQLLQKG